MSRISGGAVWSNCPRTDLARAPAEKLAGATLLVSLMCPKAVLMISLYLFFHRRHKVILNFFPIFRWDLASSNVVVTTASIV